MHLLVAYDGSKASREAVDAAAEFARALRSAHVTLFTVVDPDEAAPTTRDDGVADPPRTVVRAGAFGAPALASRPDHAEPTHYAEDAAQAVERVRTETLAALDELAHEAFADLEVETEVAIADTAAATIVSHAEAERADLIVVGTHGRSGVRRALMGSVAESVVRAAHIPVLVAGHHE
jgi:nucleotide-binding universal stress UspA family protein